MGVIELIESSDWAAPIVPRDGSLRICGDFKLTINQAAKVDTYPLPRIDDIFSRLASGKHFTTLDLVHAYLQVPLDEDSRNFVVINMHKGLYRYTSLPSPLEYTPPRQFSSEQWNAYFRVFPA